MIESLGFRKNAEKSRYYLYFRHRLEFLSDRGLKNISFKEFTKDV